MIATLASCGRGDQATQASEESQPIRSLTADDYYEKIHGAWLGSAVAGGSGMSVEGMHKRDLRPFLTDFGQWPLTDYIRTLQRHRDPDRKQWYTADDWGPVEFGPDDDSLYQIANLLLIEEKGPEITSQDIADKWLASFSVFEAQNCGRAVRVAEQLLKKGVKPPESGQHEKGEYMGGPDERGILGLLAAREPRSSREVRARRRRGCFPHQRRLRGDVHGGVDS